MVRKVFQKAGMIPGLQPGAKLQAGAMSSTEASKPRTAPGTMMGFLTAQSSAIQEAEQLKERVKELEGAAPLRRLDPSAIKPSKWANRHEASFATAEFEQLRAEISAAGGNVQPIKVRPLRVLNGSTPPPEGCFELIFGHRRHRACLELGIPVLAAVEEASDVSLFEQMERENRGRKNLSAWEQGGIIRKRLDEGLYTAAALGRKCGCRCVAGLEECDAGPVAGRTCRGLSEPAGHPVSMGGATGRGGAEGP